MVIKKENNINKKLITMRLQVFILFSILFLTSCTKEKEQTQHSYPRVIMESVSKINSNGATFEGLFLSSGDSEVIDHGFVFGTDNFLTIQTGDTVSLGPSSGSGSFTATINLELKYFVKHYVCAYATNKDKTFHSETVLFINEGTQ